MHDIETTQERFSLRELEVFRAVVESGKTTAAAARLGISQPAVSRSLARMQGRAGRSLFAKSGNRIVPTSDALALNEQIEPIFRTLNQLANSSKAEVKTETLRLIAPPTLAHRFLQSLVPDFLRDHPNISIHLEIGTKDNVVACVADGQADLGLKDARLSHAGVRLEVFRRSIAHCVLPAGHELSARKAIRIEDLKDLPYVALTRRFDVRALIEASFMEAGLEPNVVLETSTAVSAMQFVREGVGFSILNPFPIAASHKDNHSGIIEGDRHKGVVFRPFEPAIKFETAFVVPAGKTSFVARLFMDFIRQEQTEDGISTPIR